MPVVLFNGTHHLDRRALDLIEVANLGTDEELKNTVATALWLGVSPQWLQIGRSSGKWGPPFIKLSPRRVRYRVGDVKKWLAARAYRCTEEYASPSPALVATPKPRRQRVILDDPDDNPTPPRAA